MGHPVHSNSLSVADKKCDSHFDDDDDDDNDDDDDIDDAKKFSAAQKIFEKLDRGDAIDFVKKSSKSEPSSRFLSRVLVGTQGMSCLEHKECLAWDNIDPKNTTSLETMASWALKNRARKMTHFKG